MANAVFIASLASRYDDVLEQQYHFPSQYLARVQQTVGDWIIYYEPRRGGGRRVYFAMAEVVRIDPDPERAGYFYARIRGYQEFAVPVGLQNAGRYLESFISNPGGTINNGAAVNAVRILPAAEFREICQLGLSPALDQMEDAGLGAEADIVAETQSEYGGRRRLGILQRPIRDAAFSRMVRNAYDRTCAMTGLRMTNGPTRTEVQAAHIRPVDEDGPDSPRNGLALSRSIHWLFDEGLLSIEDDGRILQVPGIPDPVRRLLNADERIIIPVNRLEAPHAVFLRWHREHRFKG